MDNAARHRSSWDDSKLSIVDLLIEAQYLVLR